MGSRWHVKTRRHLPIALMAMAIASFLVTLVLTKLDALFHVQNPQYLQQNPITDTTVNSSSSSSKLGLELPLEQQDTREVLTRLALDVRSMRAQMERDSNQTSGDLAMLKRAALLLTPRIGQGILGEGTNASSVDSVSRLLVQDDGEGGDEGEDDGLIVGVDTGKMRPLYAGPRKRTSPQSDDHVHHRFLSLYRGRGWAEGPPELFVFPSLQDPISRGRLFCIRGNHTSRGSLNHYTFAPPDALPPAAALVPGTTLVSDTDFDFINPWHSMYNLFQFIFWRMDSSNSPLTCPTPSNLLLFHRGEYRTRLGPWITNLLRAVGLPTSIFPLHAHATSCFQQAVVARSGIGGMRRPMRRRMFGEARCHARARCNVAAPSRTAGSARVNVTLILRTTTNGRNFENEGAWKRVIRSRCQKAGNCSWSTLQVANLTFCEQVKAMSNTDILVSAHGAQLTNMIFMSPGGRILEIFPGGWLELAGGGQFIYKQLANWVGLRHEGYWRDPSTHPCPNPSDARACFHHYKDQPIGINETYISVWLASIITDFKSTFVSSGSHLDASINACECNKK